MISAALSFIAGLFAGLLIGAVLCFAAVAAVLFGPK